MAFDEVGNRLLVLQHDSNRLIEIKAGPDGVPGSGVSTNIDAAHFDLADPQGMAIDPIGGDLYILDTVWSEVLRIKPDPIRGFEQPEITTIPLWPHGLDTFELRGITFDPATGHLHILDPKEQRLYEVKTTGVIAANRDLSGLGLRE